MINTIDWFEIQTENISETAEFYKELFGWQIIKETYSDGSPYWIFDTGTNPRVENLRRGAFLLKQNQQPKVVFFILVNDIDSTLKKVKKLGGKVIKEKMNVSPNRYSGYFLDPNDILIGLWEE